MPESSKSTNTLKARKSAAAVPRPVLQQRMNELFLSIGKKLREGLSGEAERILTKAIADPGNTPDDLANLKRLLSFTLETTGRYKESLEAVEPYENDETLSGLSVETQVRVTTQLAIAYNNLTDQPKAVTLLKNNLEKAEEHDLAHLIGGIDIGLARVY